MLEWIVMAALASTAIADQPISWRRDHRAAYAEAEERRAPLLIQFRSDHCGRTDASGRGVAESSTADDITDCDRMERDVWSQGEVVHAVSRFVTVVTGDLTDRTLTRRYNVSTMPTTLFADPWGNEIVRVVHFVPRGKLLRIVAAMPSDFSGLERAGPALRQDPQDGAALLKGARFYERLGVREIAERYYEQAAATLSAKRDRPLRREIAIGRGTNLLQIGKAADAAGVFEASFEEAPSDGQSDVVLFGWMVSELRQGRVGEAERPYRELVNRFPGSRYAAKAKENLEAARAQPRR